MSYRTIILTALIAASVGSGMHLWAQEADLLSRRGEQPVKQQLVGAGQWQSRQNWAIAALGH